MRWWNEEVKETVKEKKVEYLKQLQRNTPEAKDEYHRARKEAKRVVRMAQRSSVGLCKMIPKQPMQILEQSEGT